MIEKAPRDEADAMREGKKEYQRGAYKRQATAMTEPSPEQRQASLMKQWQAQNPTIGEAQDGRIIAAADKTKVAERVGQGPELSPAQKKELSDFEAQQRARQITKDAKDADRNQRREDKDNTKTIFDRNPQKDKDDDDRGR